MQYLEHLMPEYNKLNLTNTSQYKANKTLGVKVGKGGFVPTHRTPASGCEPAYSFWLTFFPGPDPGGFKWKFHNQAYLWVNLPIFFSKQKYCPDFYLSKYQHL